MFNSVNRKSFSHFLLKVFLICSFVLGINSIPVFAKVNLPSISSNKYLSTYTYASSGRVDAYKDSSLRTKTGGYIACATDQCRIIEIKGKAVKVKYPVKNGWKTAWFYRDKFTYRDLANDAASLKFKSTKTITTYKWKGKNNTFGSIAKNDTCYLLRGNKNSDWLQVIYPVSSGYKMGWVKGKDAVSVIWPVSNNYYRTIYTTNMRFNNSNVYLRVGSSKQQLPSITPYNSTQPVTWSSTNSFIACVTSTGIVKGISDGEAWIVAKSGNCSTSYKVTVSSSKTYACFMNGFNGGENGEVIAASQSDFRRIREAYKQDKLSDYASSITYNFNCEKEGVYRSTFDYYIDRAYRKAKSNDTIIFGLAAHGSNEGFTLRNRKVGYNWSTLIDKLRSKNVKTIILFIHTCHSGSVIDYIRTLNNYDRNRFIVFTASDSSHTAYGLKNDDDYFEFNPFLSSVGYGLEKRNGYCVADTNRNGMITVDELYTYVYVYNLTFNYNSNRIHGLHNDLYPSFYATNSNRPVYMSHD